MYFPPPEEPRHHRWISIGIGALLGGIILILVVDFQPVSLPLPFRPESRLPPRIAHSPLDTSLASEEVSRLLVEAVIQIESHGNPLQVGSAGERGLMQIMERTWEEVSARHYGDPLPFDQAFDPAINRNIGRLYLGDLQAYLYRYQDQWRSDLRSLLLACYNAGPERVRKANFDLRQLPKTVQSYASRGSALHDWYLGDHSEELRERLIEAGNRAE